MTQIFLNDIFINIKGENFMNIKEKYNILKEYIASLESTACAFSGGVDSTLLLKVSHDVLGDKAIAITASSQSFPERELNESINFCKINNIKQIITQSNELDIPGFKDNPKNRCYLCKHELFSQIIKIAHENNIAHVIEGSNTDDLGDYRPGLQAIQELSIKSPLRKANLSKSEVRQLSWELGLPTWDKPSFACLASRFVYGEKITPEKLKMIERAEELLLSLGFRQVRVRIHDNIARIEIEPKEFSRIIEDNTRTKIYDSLKDYGFSYVTLDMKGYRTGSMNEVL